MTLAIQILQVSPESPELEAVIDLWREHSDTLGFFPDGAFEQHAAKGWLLVAVSAGIVAGYVQYRLSRGRAVIVHLCVSKAWVGKGVARRLFAEFQSRTAEANSATLTCRKDFAASAMWPRFGFVPVAERPARQSGKILVTWHLDYGHPDLFSGVAPGLPRAIIDANVFFDLGKTDSRSIESKALLEDWLVEAFVIGVTPELYTEIGRRADPDESAKARHMAGTFERTKALPDDIDHAFGEVCEVLGQPGSESDRSDRRHLAWAIASRAEYFVTHDGALLQAASALQLAFGIVVVRPSDLISAFDSEERPSAYEPGRLEGSQLSVRQLQAADAGQAKVAFQNFDANESNAGLPARLREALSRPRQVGARLVTDADGHMLGLLVSEMLPDRLRIEIGRVAKGRLGATLARHLLWSAVTSAVSTGRRLVEFADPMAGEDVDDALAAVGFFRSEAGWTKAAVIGSLTTADADQHVADLASAVGDGAGILAAMGQRLRSGPERLEHLAVMRIEHALWPLKLTDAGAPCFLVPIRPSWAAQLFDTRMASETLFASDTDVLLRLENVYYRSAQPKVLSAPGRILWYVSAGQGYSASGHICAASSLTEVTVDSAKNTFRRFRRFGVYQFRDVAALGKRSRNGKVMAFLFSHTEVLPSPVRLSDIRAVHKEIVGKQPVLVSASKLDPRVWHRLYQLGATPLKQ